MQPPPDIRDFLIQQMDMQVLTASDNQTPFKDCSLYWGHTTTLYYWGEVTR
jgi:hypothetical protein